MAGTKPLTANNPPNPIKTHKNTQKHKQNTNKTQKHNSPVLCNPSTTHRFVTPSCPIRSATPTHSTPATLHSTPAGILNTFSTRNRRWRRNQRSTTCRPTTYTSHTSHKIQHPPPPGRYTDRTPPKPTCPKAFHPPKIARSPITPTPKIPPIPTPHDAAPRCCNARPTSTVTPARTRATG